MSEQENFFWPTPPYFSYAPPEEGSLPDECLIVRHDRQKLQGTLLRFLPDQTLLEFQSAQKQKTALIDFGSVKDLRLSRPVRFVPRKFEQIQQAEAVSATGRQTFRVNFKEGEHLAGETCGFITEKTGLYLFMALDEDKVVRIFIPANAYANYAIGPPLGKMLADQQDTVDFVHMGLEFQNELRTQRIGDYLTSNRTISRERLEQVLKGRDLTKPANMLGEILLKERLVTQQELDSAIASQQRDRKRPLGEILIEMGVIDRATVNRLLVQKLGIPFVDLSRFKIEADALKVVDRQLAENHCVMPLFRTVDEIVVAMENPTDPELLHDLRFYTKLRVIPVMASQENIIAAIRTYYGQREAVRSVKELASKLSSDLEGEETAEQAVTESDNTLVRLVNQIILDAHERKASDIHIETYHGNLDTKIRFREDGELAPYLEIPAKYRNALISRIKIMANLDIAERRKPQDGKIAFERFGPAKIELRVAIMPTTEGMEDVVIRVLSAAAAIPLDTLGLRGDVLASIKRLSGMPHGLFLMCGPTGSGKTTTLHSVLGHINTAKKKIWTAEDPIEITQPGLRQVQVNSKIGLTFAAAMRSFLRLDPDVIMVGEMRDAETAKTGIEASLTGHLVLSTLHTNTAVESVTRLIDLGMDPFNFADALLGVLSQRLARALCPNCKRLRMASHEEIDTLLIEYCDGTPLDPAKVRGHWESAYANKQGQFTLCEVVGCNQCGKRGYRDRLVLHELLVNTRAIKRLIQRRANAEEIQNAALSEGMLTLKQDGIEKLLQGRTDIAQVRAVAI
jgi:type II secretory ATPase GspE/PulE/Tfp pilus assembly ATPase PilB-like protein